MNVLEIVAVAMIPAAIGYSWWRKAPISLALGVAMLAVFALQIVGDEITRTPFTLDLAVVKDGPNYSSPLTYVTSMFIHAGLVHILFNLLFLIGLGPLLEDRIGPLRWGVLFFSGGIVASLAFVAINYQAAAFALLGASGALSAVFGAFGRLYPRERISMWVLVPLPAMPAINYVLGFIVIEFLLSFVAFGFLPFLAGIAWEAHVAGAVFGFAAAPLVMRIPSRRRRQEKVRDFSALRPLVRGPDLDEIYEHISKETLPDAQEAWLERFASRARCPQCGKPLQWMRGSMRSECGWRLRP